LVAEDAIKGPVRKITNGVTKILTKYLKIL
jgi:hypothetical protein